MGSVGSLTIESDGKRYVLTADEIASIGRDATSVIALGDDRISRRHAIVRADAAGWIYEDLASTNGSYVDGSRIGRIRLSGDQEIRLGNAAAGPLLRLRAPSSTPAAAPNRTWAIVFPIVALLLLAGAYGLSQSGMLTPSSTSSPTSSAAPTVLSRADATALGRAGTVMVVQGNSQGSGSYLGGGRVLTAAHVVESNAIVVVYFENQRIGSAQIVRRDPQKDLALLSIVGLDGAGARALEWRDSSTLREGEELLAVGYPEGLPFSVKVGVVSGLRKIGSTDLIQTDASLNHGMSGGPVLDSAGRLIGVTDFGYPGAVGLNFAVASSTARVFVEAQR